jgi:hypothetical protein
VVEADAACFRNAVRRIESEIGREYRIESRYKLLGDMERSIEAYLGYS